MFEHAAAHEGVVKACSASTRLQTELQDPINQTVAQYNEPSYLLQLYCKQVTV
jgi:hypothetical protein